MESVESAGAKFIVKIPIPENNERIMSDKPADDSIDLQKDISELVPWDKTPAENRFPRKQSILIVEDDEELRNFLINELSREYLVHQSANGEEGMGLAFSINPDLILSDIMMPGMDGIEFCRKIKSDERTSHLPVILLSAVNSQEKQIEGLETGADDYIFKPFNIALLKTRINNLLLSRYELRKKFDEGNSLDFNNENLNSKDKKLVQSVIDVVVQNITYEKINAEFISQKLLISRSLLYIKIEALTGQTVNEFVRNIRLKKSMSMLLHKGSNVSEVAYAVGFSSQSYFTRCFKRKFGKAPSEIR